MLKTLININCRETSEFLDRLYYGDINKLIEGSIKATESFLQRLLNENLIKPFNEEQPCGKLTSCYTLTQKGLASVQARSEFSLAKKTNSMDLEWNPFISAISTNPGDIPIPKRMRKFVNHEVVDLMGRLNACGDIFHIGSAKLLRINLFDAMIEKEIYPEEIFRSSKELFSHIDTIKNHDIDGECVHSIFELCTMLGVDQFVEQKDLIIIDSIKLHPALIGKGIGRDAVKLIQNLFSKQCPNAIMMIKTEAHGHDHCPNTKKMFSEKIKRSYESCGFFSHPFNSRYSLKLI